MSEDSSAASWLNSDDPSERCTAAHYLGDHPTNSHLELLIARAICEHDEWTFAFILEVIAESYVVESGPAFGQIMSGVSSPMHAFILLSSACNRNCKLDRDALSHWLQSPEWFVRLAAVKCFCRFGYFAEFGELLSQIQDDIEAFAFPSGEPDLLVSGDDILWNKDAATGVVRELRLSFSA